MRALLTLSPLLSGAQVWACWCGHISIEEEFAASKAVFLATVVAEELTGGATTVERWHVQLQVHEVWKSDGQSLSSIDTPIAAGSCGMQLMPGMRYIIFASRNDDGTLETRSCNRTTGVEFGPRCAAYPVQCDDHKRRVQDLLSFLEKVGRR
jgi:hypothetical protein